MAFKSPDGGSSKVELSPAVAAARAAADLAKANQGNLAKPTTTNALQAGWNSALAAANNQFPDSNSQQLYQLANEQTTKIIESGNGSVVAGLQQMLGQTNLSNPLAPSNNPANSVYVGNGEVANVPDYLWADLAKAYGMDASTAYQEALSNTSYQRAVADLQAAGLNPLLAVNGLSGAGGVYGASPMGDGTSYGGSSGKGAHQWFNIFSNLGTAVGAIVGKGYTGATAGKAIGSVIGNFLDGQYK